ncbi:acyl-CoA thioesterase [Aureitalea marina]|uniref:Thioesterase n=1 Tax=Aureitalea marina TaxID=930804 RepID=A0A2S7KN43_9FLAO|nr:acyl-CoA thioesterase [Aureitalea marina]PQB04045.1 thioesterase [Aureitalea marina]
MDNLPKILETKTRIRFQHCDPFNHLNNAEYLNYMVNAREDQLIENYGIDIYEMARKEGKSWVVGSNQIAYIRPAWTMEEVLIQSQLISFDQSSLQVELRMYSSDRTELKALMWSRYVHFDLINQKRHLHDPEFMNLFQSVVEAVEQHTFEDRLVELRMQAV